MIDPSVRITEARAGRFHFALDGPRGGSGITAVEVILAHVGTNTGHEGWGFSYILRGHWGASLAAAQDIAADLIGLPLPHPESAWRQATAKFNRTGGGPNLIGLAALDVALWDLWGNIHNRSISALLGGGGKDGCPVYASGGFSAGQDPDEAGEIASAAMALGYLGVKPRVSGRASDRALLGKVRDAIGEDALLLADANEKLNLPQALALARWGTEFRLDYLEEPLPSDDLDGLRVLARHSTTALATGEHFQDDRSVMPVLREGLVALIQPDLAMMGGLTPCLRAARAAETFGVQLSPHFLPGLFVQLHTACPALTMVEEFPLIEPMFEGWPAIENGVIRPTAAYGHGLRPRADVIDRFERGA
jgi:L-alanine-DL-glutamate epimerase-like enolase superfamily enzyme